MFRTEEPFGMKLSLFIRYSILMDASRLPRLKAGVAPQREGWGEREGEGRYEGRGRRGAMGSITYSPARGFGGESQCLLLQGAGRIVVSLIFATMRPSFSGCARRRR